VNLALQFRDTFSGKLGHLVVQELDNLTAGIIGHWSVEHKADGTHGAITADSLTLAGPVKVQTVIQLGQSRSRGIDGAATDVEYLALGKWNVSVMPRMEMLGVPGDRELWLTQMKPGFDGPTLKVYQASPTDAVLLPGSPTNKVTLGEDTFQRRFKAVHTTLLTTTSARIGGIAIRTGSGSPNSAVTGSLGDLYVNDEGGAGQTLWVKESGWDTDTGWVAK
jgi:hypothetical protein